MAEAQHLMRHRRIRHLPVAEGGRLAGIITDRDVRTVMPSRQRAWRLPYGPEPAG